MYQVLSPPQEGEPNVAKIAARVSDILLLLHFVSDPYIYVLLRNNRQRNPFNVMIKKILNTKDNGTLDEQKNLSLENVVECNNIINNNNQRPSNISNSRRVSVVCFSSSVIEKIPAGQTRESFH